MEIIQRITVGAFMIGIVWGEGFQLWSLLTQIGSEYCGFGGDLQCKYGAITIRKRLRQTKFPRTRQPFRCELKNGTERWRGIDKPMLLSIKYPARRGPFVYQLGHGPLKAERRVRF